MKLQGLIVSFLVSYAVAVAVPEAEPEADAEMLEQRAIGSYCQQSGQPDKGTCQKESWCKAAAQVGITARVTRVPVTRLAGVTAKGDPTLQVTVPGPTTTNVASIEENGDRYDISGLSGLRLGFENLE
ncbi:hypothetical protein BKA65DRAFT_536828 [Rhexocercosporidium sp. MPI-PUGE-AT-0058]|nr:hypothetical protein BKA65DRAFT_536828 [Rhexocercosporidium sp. MPI-PUGE-AT-0058]